MDWYRKSESDIWEFPFQKINPEEQQNLHHKKKHKKKQTKKQHKQK